MRLSEIAYRLLRFGLMRKSFMKLISKEYKNNLCYQEEGTYRFGRHKTLLKFLGPQSIALSKLIVFLKQPREFMVRICNQFRFFLIVFWS